MQVVYSGGSTPSPSPRLHRKQYTGYGRPVQPGYVLGPPPVTTMHRSPSREKNPPIEEDDSSLRDSIPVMSKPLAITCLICNIVLPGLGTFISGLSILCCTRAKTKEMSKKKIVLVNTWVAFLQFITAFVLLLGWIWSIMWGAAFMSISDQHYEKLHSENNRKGPDKLKEEATKTEKEELSPHKELPKPDPPSSPKLEPIPPFTNTAPSTITGSASDTQLHPMIVLQEIPVVNQSESTLYPARPILNARTRHQKILRRQMSDNDLSPFSLTQEQLQEIVIHAAPVNRRRGLPRGDSAASEPSATGTTLINVAEK
ncbi:uncharacterized protein LOC110450550 [Mizuhopecten yessoensis]|uniref:Protein SPEC3 n=1 Tax=Mizuhopecten yessoensis TaxID=6573 RepID=A0A210QNP9_MIZYE|nr:uncharacterized protein LOC110450550 [Mizuhopecten yessoensis]OWF50328.1 Protein SPEC3 [Mizuhopecten yessoensis]